VSATLLLLAEVDVKLLNPEWITAVLEHITVIIALQLGSSVFLMHAFNSIAIFESLHPDASAPGLL